MPASLENFYSYTQPHIRISFFFTMRTHRQLEGVLSAHGGSLRYEGISQIQIWYVFSERGEHRLLFGYTFFGHPWKLLKLYPTVHSYLFFLHTVLYCFYWEHRQLEGVLCVHGASLRYEGISPNSNMFSERGEP